MSVEIQGVRFELCFHCGYPLVENKVQLTAALTETLTALTDSHFCLHSRFMLKGTVEDGINPLERVNAFLKQNN
jgi:hypothetical protein